MPLLGYPNLERAQVVGRHTERRHRLLVVAPGWRATRRFLGFAVVQRARALSAEEQWRRCQRPGMGREPERVARATLGHDKTASDYPAAYVRKAAVSAKSGPGTPVAVFACAAITSTFRQEAFRIRTVVLTRGPQVARREDAAWPCFAGLGLGLESRCTRGQLSRQ